LAKLICLPPTQGDQTSSSYLVLQRQPKFRVEISDGFTFATATRVEDGANWTPAAYLTQFFTGSNADATELRKRQMVLDTPGFIGGGLPPTRRCRLLLMVMP